jgi:hypothetical protein
MPTLTKVETDRLAALKASTTRTPAENKEMADLQKKQAS